MKALVKNAADEEQVKDARDAEKFSRDQALNDMRLVLSSMSGRRFLWNLLETCHVYRSTYSGSGHNDQTNFNEGQRAIGLRVLADITAASPEAYLKMMQEAKEREEKQA